MVITKQGSINVGKLEGYHAYGRGFFDIEKSKEVLNWKFVHGGGGPNNPQILKFKEWWGLHVESYDVYEIPMNYRRNKWDNAKVLTLRLTDGKLIGRRFNNNQKYKIGM